MIYLIGQLSVWLILTAAFCALAGWSLASQRLAPAARALERERENLLNDISRFAGGESDVDPAAAERELDALRRLAEVRDGRIAELEQSLAAARARADEAVSRLAEAERGRSPTPEENQELSRLRALVAQHEEERAREVEVVAEPAPEDESVALQAWRLRYFEQRVRYLEGLAATVHVPAEAAPAQPLAEWRAREASARARHLEQELRAALTPAPVAEAPAASESEAEPFAADASVDTLLRWRMLYLERRVAHLQQEAARRAASAPPPEEAPTPAEEAAPDPDRWKWRARYLEARLRHLEEREPAAIQPVAAPAPVEEETALATAPSRPTVRGEKPPVLQAPRDGAPDDFTLIEDVSVLQQTTLYSIGVFHFDQIAAWTPANVAWVDQYLRLRGRIDEEEWVEQARTMSERGVGASRRMLEDTEA